ncbi:MAG: RHS repeat-associated core domain-containing protein [Polyangiaceae bacterium]|nr:RHS repeat-associated core domain-containing protein [Polyangiaceae bacterium]
MVAMPHLANVEYTHSDQMRVADLGGGGTAYYAYDAGGERVRKVIQRIGTTREERIYLGGWELYRKRQGANQEVVLERETLHLMDDTRRIAMVETKTIDADVSGTLPIVPRIRYQYSNHLDSAHLECDESGLVISYEECHPYGTPAYRSAKSGVEVSEKRFRYTGKERDDETGFQYHSARYYAPWLGRWTTADPAGMVDGPCLFGYCRENPVDLTDLNGMDSSSLSLQAGYQPFRQTILQTPTLQLRPIAPPNISAVTTPIVSPTPEEQEAQVSDPALRVCREPTIPIYSDDSLKASFAGPPPASRYATLRELRVELAYMALTLDWSRPDTSPETLGELFAEEDYARSQAYTTALIEANQQLDFEVMRFGISWIPIFGDGIDIGISVSERDWVGVALGAAGIVPGGDLLKLGRLGKLANHADDTRKLLSGRGRSLTVNAFSRKEAALAQEILEHRGGVIVGPRRRNLEGIDGTIDGLPMSLKETEGGLGAVLRHASVAEKRARKAGYTGVELFMRAKNVASHDLLDFALKGPLSEIPNQGTISAINILTVDGWIRIPGRMP